MQLSESAQKQTEAMDAHTGSEQFKPGTQARGSALRPLSLCTRLGVFRLRHTKARSPANRPVTIALTEKMLAISYVRCNYS